MVKLGCTINGNLDDSKFNQPMPWIGIYIATASAACAIAMAADAFHGFRQRKFWFPCKLFSLNATTLTLIGVAIKLSVDLNTSMPGRHDQLAKLSSAALICTVMGNSLPSLGTMENKEIFMNIMALGILVVTAIVNICIQLGTGVIYVFWKEHAFMMFLMLVLLAILCSSALTVPATKRFFDLCPPICDRAFGNVYCLRGVLPSGCSDLSRSHAEILLHALVLQILQRCPKKANRACKPQFIVESYWIQKLVEWKECPLTFRFCGRYGRKLTHDAKNLVLDFCIRAQNGIVVVSKLVRLISIFFMFLILRCYHFCKELKRSLKCNNNVTDNDLGSESQPGSELDLSRFVLHLEGEEELVDLMIENNCGATDHWFSKGKKKQPRFLIQLLQKSMSLKELKGVNEFDSGQVPSLDAEEPPNCWALPVVTLTSIAVSLPGIERHLIKQLIRSVQESLAYVRLVENNLNANEELTNIRKAAKILWLGIDLHQRWLDVDLRKMAHQAKSPEKVLEELADIAKNRFFEFRKKDIHECLRENPSRWPIKMLAANSMYRVSRTILLDYESRNYEGSEILFQRLSAMIADILGACLTNLPRVIPMECHRSTIEEREECVQHAIVLLGKSEKILEILEQQLLSNSDPEQLACIDGWRSLSKQITSLQPISSSTVSDTNAFSSSDVYLSID